MNKTSSSRKTPISLLLLIGWLLLFTLSWLKPSAAFEFLGVKIALGGVVLLAITHLFCLRDDQGTILFFFQKQWWAESRIWVLIWGGFWVMNLYLHKAFYPSGRQEVFLISMAVLAFLTTYRLGEIFQGETTSEESTPALLIYTRWLVILLGVGGLFAVYQCYGPAGLPMTFETLKESIATSLPPGDPLREGLLHAMNEKRAMGTIGAPNIYASFCVFGWCCALSMLMTERITGLKIIAGLGALGCLAGVLLSQSNGGILALLAGTGIFALILSWKYLPGKVAMALTGFAITLGIVGSVMLIYILLSADESSRLVNKSGLTQRLFYWKTALSIFQESPLTGAGPGGFEGLYALHRTPGSNETKMVHSWFFKYLSTSGIIGMMLFFLFVGFWKKQVLPFFFNAIKQKNNRQSFILGGLLTACGAISLHGLIEYTFSFQEAFVLLLATMGLIAGSHSVGKTNNGTKVNKAIVYPVVLTLVIAFGVSVNNYKLVPAKGNDYREAAAYLITEGGNAKEISSLYEEAINIDPSNPVNWEHRGVYRLRRGDARGLKDLEKALSLNPYSSRLKEQLALNHAAKKQYDKAIELQLEAVNGHPLDTSHRLTLAEMYEESGNHEKALETYESTLDLLAPGKMEKRRRKEVGEKLGYTEEKSDPSPAESSQ